MQTNEEVISTQVEKLSDVINTMLPKGTQYALIDFPDHSNVGDSAIWLGEIKLLAKLTKNFPSYTCTVEMFDESKLLEVLPSGPILIHGGGNFGDIWRHHQDFRELILEKFKDRMVIQLPQSLKFSDQSAIDNCARLIAEHGNFQLLVRDQQSLEFAEKYFNCSTKLVPDAAFALGPLNRLNIPSYDIFMLLRTDSERASYDRLPFNIPNAISDDWLYEPKSFHLRTKLKAGMKALFTGNRSQQRRRFLFYQMIASARLKRGLEMLSSGKMVITDRLHAHILSTLLDIPHVALDNNYGKVSGYINAWTKSYPGVQIATTANEALQKLNVFKNTNP